MSYDERRTDDPYKHDRLGLGDPTEGGNGVLVEVFGQNDFLALLSDERTRIFAFVLPVIPSHTEPMPLPPFYNRRAWLVEIVDIEPAAIRSVRITDSRN